MILHFDLPDWMIISYLFIIGSVIGSFLNVCVHRIPSEPRFLDQLRSLWNRPSHCPRCDTDIFWSDNIPIFGWIKLRGRCRNCQMRISPRYPLVEFANGCLFVLVYLFEVPGGFHPLLSESSIYSEIGPQIYPGLNGWSPEAFVWLRYAFHMVMIEALLVASLIDFDLRIIPDGSTLPAMIFAVIASTTFGILHIVPVWFQDESLARTFSIVTPDWVHPLISGPRVPEWISLHPHLHGLAVSLIGLIVGGGVVWAVRLLGFLFLREEAMGFGDVVLMAMVGAFLGWQPTVVAFFLAPLFALLAILGTAVFVRDRSIPYGPYLSLATLVTVLFWKQISPIGTRFFDLGILLFPLILFLTGLFAACLAMVFAVKKAMGWLPPEIEMGVWRAADQNCFVAGENVDRHSCRWKSEDWEGCASGRGQIHEERWRRGQAGSSNSMNRPNPW
ncbi:Leader peptidase PppA [Thalassoglobus neptunius]|uniref:Leader peptidase PppA n=1 Tax=Thalassoglobus neptunius TaxID=1938619 RepID=A0A5C5WPM4_9PLAN|nr:A24 family peptidase [Thalassoglobus neptunius]TWT51963.1 Leader peptidase PppA [Thalassoglobus neptunius]